MKSKSDSVGFRTVVRAFAPDLWALRRRFVLANSVTLLAIAANALSPWPLKLIIDTLLDGPARHGRLVAAFGGSSTAVVLGLGGVYLLLSVVVALAQSGDGMITAQIKERLSYRLRDRVMTHMQALPPTIRMTHRSGELVLRLVGDVDQFTRLWTKTVPLLGRHAITTLVTIGAITWLSPLVGVSCLLGLPALAVLVRHHSRRVAETSRVKRRREGEVAGVAQEIVRGLPVIQALGATESARQRFGVVSATSLAAGVESSLAAARLERSFELARGGALAVVTAGGAFLVLRGWLTIGELTVLSAYVTQLVRPIDKINDLTEALSRGVVAGERLFKLLAEKPLVTDKPGAIEVGRSAGRVELRDVWFSYPTHQHARPPVLRGAHIVCEPGTLTVLVGQSGAGKTTIISLLVRLFDPTAGQILLDGRPLTDLALRSLRSQFAVMTQDLHLFSGTMRQALTADVSDVSDTRIWEALAFVALDDFARGLPAQLDAPLGEDGLNLSGGQRQRLSLARAFLLDRPILLLDEPLSNVDAGSARVILSALEQLRVGRTCIAITHESTLVAHADVVYRLHQGRALRDMPRQTAGAAR